METINEERSYPKYVDEINLLYPKAVLVKRSSRKGGDFFQMFYYDNNRVCEYCGITEQEYKELRSAGDGPMTLTKDHVIPKSAGGKHGKTVWACCKCNLTKNHTFTYEEMKIIGQMFVRPVWEAIAKRKRGYE